MQIFENLLLQNYSKEYLDILPEFLVNMLLVKLVQMLATPTLLAKK